MYYGVEFYSKNRDIVLADRIKEVLSNKDLGVLYIDDLDDFIVDKDRVVRYLIINYEEKIQKVLDSIHFGLIAEILIMRKNLMIK